MNNLREGLSTFEIAEELGLKKDEYEQICSLMGRIPNIHEISIFSAMWSEHCSYKSSRKWLKTLPTKGEVVIHGPGENAGAIDIGDGKVAIFKIESHNHPSFIEPYQGAATGVGGILRDVFTMGARPVALLNALRFGSVENNKTKYLLEGVVSGIGGYGNCIGIPTIGGETNFDKSYDGNILVNAMAIGITEKDKIFLSAARGVGYPLIYVGAKTGRDGIHGASMSSTEFDDKTEEKRPTVQVGDPFTGKLLMEACLELMTTDSVVAIQDMGAAGLTSSAVEMGSKGKLGVKLDLDLVPLREENMSTAEIMLSESQERMLMIIKPDKMDKANSIFKKWNLDIAKIGEITNSQNLEIYKNNILDAQIPITYLVDQAPEYDRDWTTPEKAPELQIKNAPIKSVSKVIEKLFNSHNLCSRNWIWEQYDTSVMGDTVIPPGQNSGVIRVHGTNKKLCASVDCTPRYVSADPFLGSMQAVCEAYRNIISVGGTPLAITNNLNFGNPEKKEIMGQIVHSIKGISEASLKLNMPVISGNVSLYNETNGKAILPTPVIGAVGVIDENKNSVSLSNAVDGNSIFVIGQDNSHTDGWVGQSIYAQEILDIEKDYAPPPVNIDAELANGNFILKAIEQKLTNCVHDISDGGLAIAISEILLSSRAKGIGAVINKNYIHNSESFWFGEDQGRYLVCTSKNKEIEELAESNKIKITNIATINLSDRLTFSNEDYICISELDVKHKNWFKNFMS